MEIQALPPGNKAHGKIMLICKRKLRPDIFRHCAAEAQRLSPGAAITPPTASPGITAKQACSLLKIPTSGHKKTITAITNNKRQRLLLLNFTALPALLKQSGITAIKQGQKPENLNADARQ